MAEDATERRIRHLEMIQAVVTRVAGHSATVKNLCLTVVTALIGFAMTNDAGDLGLLAIALILIFALLDAQYLRVERRYRLLFDQVREADWGGASDFSLDVRAMPGPPLFQMLISWSVWTFYVPLALVSFAIERVF